MHVPCISVWKDDKNASSVPLFWTIVSSHDKNRSGWILFFFFLYMAEFDYLVCLPVFADVHLVNWSNTKR
jgi:hypothetical protein